MQLPNQVFLLSLNGNPVTELRFDPTGIPSIGDNLNVDAMKTFCAVMTLLLGELPPPETDLVLRVERARRGPPPPPKLYP